MKYFHNPKIYQEINFVEKNPYKFTAIGKNVVKSRVPIKCSQKSIVNIFFRCSFASKSHVNTAILLICHTYGKQYIEVFACNLLGNLFYCRIIIIVVAFLFFLYIVFCHNLVTKPFNIFSLSRLCSFESTWEKRKNRKPIFKDEKVYFGIVVSICSCSMLLEFCVFTHVSHWYFSLHIFYWFKKTERNNNHSG